MWVPICPSSVRKNSSDFARKLNLNNKFPAKNPNKQPYQWYSVSKEISVICKIMQENRRRHDSINRLTRYTYSGSVTTYDIKFETKRQLIKTKLTQLYSGSWSPIGMNISAIFHGNEQSKNLQASKIKATCYVDGRTSNQNYGTKVFINIFVNDKDKSTPLCKVTPELQSEKT